jgi:hypothetical protein
MRRLAPTLAFAKLVNVTLPTLAQGPRQQQALDPRPRQIYTQPNPYYTPSLDLIHETVEMRQFNLSIPTVPLSRQSPEGYARGLADAFKSYMEKAPSATYRLSRLWEQIPFIHQVRVARRRCCGLVARYTQWVAELTEKR